MRHIFVVCIRVKVVVLFVNDRMAGINLAKEKFEEEKKVKLERERLARLAEEQREAIKQMERERKEVVFSYT